MSFDYQPFLKQLTQHPGIYQMIDAEGAVLYVGKARNLRKRVSSYFRKSGLPPKTQALVSRIARIDVTITETEVEALILEQNLIKQARPPYNILLRDDKSYPYIFLSDRDSYPRLSFHRGAKKRKGSYFGPFPGAQAVRDSMSFLQKTFRVRQCEDAVFRNRARPCLQYQIKRCTAPCVGLIDTKSYQRDVRHTAMFLQGGSDKLVRELEKDMDKAAAEFAYERAAEIRDQIISLRKVQAEQVIESGKGNIDVIAAANEGDKACVHMLYIRHGRILGSRSFYPKVPLASSSADVLVDFMPQYYLREGARGDFPREVLLPETIPDEELLESALSGAAGRKVLINSRSRSTRQQWLQLALRTAQQNLAGRLAERKNLLQKFTALGEALQMDEPPERLECFDISHSSGEATVASCVVFNQEGAVKSDYRRFNIEGIEPGDDYAAMEQALTRRYTRLQKGEGKMPDVLLIDGGIGQMRKAQSALNELGVAGITVVGVAKGVTRKPGFETLFLVVGDREIELDIQSSGLLLVQQVRDEAHRFAITGHRQRRDKKRRTSPLENIEGVGPGRRRELLRFFGGLKEVERASVAELMRVPTISRKVAEAIYSALRNG
ncbi:MAG: excinuclease ABC subunit UvrC [Pseudomonadales bacterium]|nr:excinuclease ABC subunit UvrC [Pseudomonadales bacterium]MCP5171756.1 excinuclease ABC subunit UvrC [Pseudomonadales bacterium]